MELATKQISSKRLELDEVLSKVNGVQFFLSCITALCSNEKKPKNTDSDKAVAPGGEKAYPAVAYFIAYRINETCNENALYAILHNQDTEPVVRPIVTRKKTSTNKAMEKAARQLFQVLKDHNNAWVIDMLEKSNAYCFAECSRTSSARYRKKRVNRPIIQLCRVVWSSSTESNSGTNSTRRYQFYNPTG